MFRLYLLAISFIVFSCNASNDNALNQKNNVDMLAWVKSNNIEKVAQGLKQGADVNQVDSKGRNLLHLAVIHDNLPMAELLVSQKANVNQQSKNLDSPFLLAGASGKTHMVQLFLNNGARFDVYNRYGGSALIPAAEKGHIQTVKLLSSTPNYPIDHVNSLGWTALMEAVILGDGSSVYQEVVQILKQAGCDVSIPDKNGTTALQHARKRGYTKIVQILSK